ncbi:phosphoribosyl-AMP cyclohydrolase [bacterium (Candidatus Gribaldobacteria) CG02_land_8_20_14_3_00_41_15]|uniref:Phosphoribosyl-AMP cyclohydrolase n=1 Tax=bacterium (Candidatus Gribaldobacteria) CG02_land_8_20_14_3_00_41_15 TaxID=2014270 RepID=A0A2M7DE78_9BACT|nr:MAG: phosphoribosyl-AMP cyclohydrolase [bacterium (Candidatus Gribaldobacteria) CG02_land_8_20_14_3_00_41_15]
MSDKLKTIKIKNISDFVQQVDWAKVNGLAPVITQDYWSSRVLMLGYMNREALQKTLTEGKITYYSRIRSVLWTKGETSGNFQIVKKVFLDCDNDTILIKIKQKGAVCHTGRKTCFYQEIN